MQSRISRCSMASTPCCARLPNHGVQLALVSSDSEANARRKLGDLAALFAYFDCSASLFGKSAKFRRVIRRAGVDPADVIAIGDEIRDIEAARAVGIACGAVAGVMPRRQRCGHRSRISCSSGWRISCGHYQEKRRYSRRSQMIELKGRPFNLRVIASVSVAIQIFSAGRMLYRTSPANDRCNSDSRSSAACGSGPFSAALSASSNCCGVAMPTRIVPIAGCEIANRVAASVRLAANPSLTSGIRRRARSISAS